MKHKLLLCLSTLLVVPFATAQNTSPCPQGQSLSIVRVSEVKPGQADTFRAAVAAHQNWYKTHGYHDVIFSNAVLPYDNATNKFGTPGNEMVSYHFAASHIPPDKHDKDWDAYVKLYNDSSDVKQTRFECGTFAPTAP